jgi:hypothetical protein
MERLGATDAWDFVNQSYLRAGRVTAPGLTVTRASDGYAETSDGRLVNFGSNVLRRTDRGVLVEGARTNLLTRSQEFGTNWAPTNATVSSDVTVAPDNTTTADKLIATAASGIHRVFSTDGGNAVNGVSYTLSVFAKASEYGFVRLTDTTYMTAGPVFDLTTGAVSSTGGFTATITALANGWYRCAATFTASGTALLVSQILAFPSSSTSDYTGDGTSGLFLWGAQLEASSSPSSYTKTESGTATRATDDIQVAVATVPNTSPLTFFAEYDASLFASDASSPRIFNWTSSATTNVLRRNTAAEVAARFASSGTFATQGSLPTTIQKVAVAYVFGQATKLSANGFAVVTGTDVGIAIPASNLQIGNIYALTGSLNTYLRRFAIIPRTLSDAELQEVTA